VTNHQPRESVPRLFELRSWRRVLPCVRSMAPPFRQIRFKFRGCTPITAFHQLSGGSPGLTSGERCDMVLLALQSPADRPVVSELSAGLASITTLSIDITEKR
jgi:hypothetical protein